MKKLILTLTFAGISTVLLAYTSLAEQEERSDKIALVLGSLLFIIVWAITLWYLINSATRANRLVKINLLQLELQLREHNARTGQQLTISEFAKELPRLNEDIKNADLDSSDEGA